MTASPSFIENLMSEPVDAEDRPSDPIAVDEWLEQVVTLHDEIARSNGEASFGDDATTDVGDDDPGPRYGGDHLEWVDEMLDPVGREEVEWPDEICDVADLDDLTHLEGLTHLHDLPHVDDLPHLDEAEVPVEDPHQEQVLELGPVDGEFEIGPVDDGGGSEFEGGGVFERESDLDDESGGGPEGEFEIGPVDDGGGSEFEGGGVFEGKSDLDDEPEFVAGGEPQLDGEPGFDGESGFDGGSGLGGDGSLEVDEVPDWVVVGLSEEELLNEHSVDDFVSDEEDAHGGDEAIAAEEPVDESTAGLLADGGAPEGDIETVLDGSMPVDEAPQMTEMSTGEGRTRKRHHRRRAVVGALALALALVALGGGSGHLLAWYLPERWTAEAEVILEPGTDQVDQHLATQQVLVKSSTILDAALEDLPVDRDDVDERLKVFPIESGAALGLTFDDEDPDLALSVLDAVVTSFMAEVDRESTIDTRPIYEARIQNLNRQRQQLELRLKRMESANAAADVKDEAQPYPGEVRRMTLESEQLLARINNLQETILVEDVATAEPVANRVVTAPRVMAQPTFPKPLAFTALGLLVGSIVAAVVLFLLASRRAG